MFSSLQKNFSEALLHPEMAVPAGIVCHTSLIPEKRFAVYRNNIVTGLVNALRTRFPAVEKIVGEEFFFATAREFVQQHLPRSPLMMNYGDNFPDFLSAFVPAAELPYLADVARLEALRTDAYHAADAAPLHSQALQEMKPDVLQCAAITLHPSLRLLRSRYPVVNIWAMNSGEAELGPVDLDAPEDALVMREYMTVTVRKLPLGGAQFVSALLRQNSFSDAVECALNESDQFDLARNLAALIAAGAITGVIPPSAEKDFTL
jgi:hypothetical protein